jgi:hypothetical protein
MMLSPVRSRCARGLAIALTVASPLSLATLSPAGAPPNDDCSSPTTIQLGQTPFTNVDATIVGAPMCEVAGADVWFKHRAKWTGQLRVSTCDDANFDTIIAVYRGTSCNTQTLLTNQIGCNDESPGCSDHTSQLTVDVTKDQVYLIRVAGFQGDTGSGVLTLSCGDPSSATCAEIIKTGAAADDRLGYAIATGGLMNTGNNADLLVGAYRNDTGGSNAGQARVFKGTSNGTLGNLYTFNGESGGDNFGFATATCDFNNDGRLDIVIGAPLNDDAAANAGKVYAFDGFTGALLWTQVGQTAGDRFGYACGCAGDVDDDGWEDAIVGAPFHDASGTSTGRAYIIDGQNGNRLRTHTGQAAGDQFGYAVSGATDLNDDGNHDYAVGSPFHDTVGNDAGRVTLFDGVDGGVLIRLDGNATGDRFGSAITSARFDAGNEYSYILIGSPFSDFAANNAGRARLFFRNHDNPGEGGCAAIVCLALTINGSTADGRLGSSVALGDVVGDARADMFVGSPYSSLAGNSSGAAFLFNGVGGPLIDRFLGEAAGDRFATAIAFAGDIDNNGANDFAAGGPFNDAGGSNAGRAYVFLAGTDDKANDSGGGASLPNERRARWDSGAPITPMVGDPQVQMPQSAPQVQPNVPGDVTRDGRVDAADLSAVIAMFGPCPGGVDAACDADLTGDRRVDVDDLLAVIFAWQ